MAPLVTDLIGRAMAGANLNAWELSKRSGISYNCIMNIFRPVAGQAKNGCRVDTLVTLLDACGYELRMERKTK